MIVLVIAIANIATHLFYFSFPRSVVFDEVFYGNFIEYYWQGAYFFDQHPPFFKIFVAFIGKIIGIDNITANWDHIGNLLPIEFTILRLIPIIAGILLPIIIYLICRHLNFSAIASFFAVLIITFENSLIVQSRFILPDIVMLLFGFLAILFYLKYRKCSKQSLFFALFSIFSGLTFSIKWTGGAFLLLILIIEIYHLLKTDYWTKSFFIKTILFSTKYITIIICIYLSLFIIHFSSLPYSGKGDIFMTERFQSTLIGNYNYSDNKNIGFFEKFIELNKIMFTTNSNMSVSHPDSSKWYTWPLMEKSIFYWQDSYRQSERSYIYFIGNPFVYWLGSLSIFILILILINDFIKKNKVDNIKLFLISGFLINFLPFILIGRVMFLYHYASALIFSILTFAYLIDSLNKKTKITLIIISSIIIFSAFIYWSPLTYGIPLKDNQLNSRIWFSSWR